MTHPVMRLTIIVYLPGYAGNFLMRLIGLSPETIPHVPKKQLIDNVVNGTIPDIGDRSDWYSFKNVLTDFPSWQEFHRQWPDYHEHKWFEWMNDLYGRRFTDVVYAMHPHEFMKFEKDINAYPATKFWYVDTNSELQDWVDAAQKKLGFEYRKNELEQFRDITQKYSMAPINLAQMLSSESAFTDEYLKICEIAGLSEDCKQAMKLYTEWRSLRVDSK